MAYIKLSDRLHYINLSNKELDDLLKARKVPRRTMARTKEAKIDFLVADDFVKAVKALTEKEI